MAAQNPSFESLASGDAIIEARNVSVNFGDVHALIDASLTVPEGQVRGLLGPNGAGKTTLVNVISTLLSPTSGTALVNGFDVTKQGKQVRSIIGLAGQYAAVDNLLTGRENLEIVGSLYQLSRSEAKAQANDVLERLSLTEAADRPVKTYSGGMRRRLDLGASLVGRPKVLILDEPTTGLDPRTRIELWDFLKDLVTEGTTVLLTTQYLEEADALADEITLIDSGRVIAEGTPSALKEKIGGSSLVLATRNSAEIAEAARLVAVIGNAEPVIDEDKASLSMHVDSDSGAIVQAAQALDSAGIAVSELALQSPSLDEVFLRLTKGGN